MDVDTFFVGRFAENALRIFEAAESIGDAGVAPDMAILITESGGIRLISQSERSDWPLDSLRTEHGASMAYRVTRHDSRVRLEGCADRRSCSLEAPALVTMKALLGYAPHYTVV